MIGVFVAPIEYYFGLKKAKTVEKWVGVYDMVFYEIGHYFSLLLKNNPNVLSLLFLKPEHYIHVSELGQRIIANRNIFISKNVFFSYTGYARGQLKKIEKYNREGYMGEKRKALVEKNGYDTKNAAHLIRLLRQGIETLGTGRIEVNRKDASELLSIKNGEWDLEEVKECAQKLFKQAELAFGESHLPDNPDYEKVSELLIGILRDFHYESEAVRKTRQLKEEAKMIK